MNTMQAGIVTLLKSAVTQQSFALPPEFDLEQTYAQVKGHHMAALLYEGAALCGLDRESPVMRRLFQSYCKSMLVSEGQMREADRLFKAFDAHGIDYMPLKGCNMKGLYPKPELRGMGDADILIRMEQYGRIVPIMESLGYCAGAEWDHELKWIKKALLVELHRRIVPSGSKDLYAYFGDGWQFAQPREGFHYAMQPESELVYLFSHFSNHYRAGGIGCRHVVDLWVFLRANPGLDEEAVKVELEKLRLREFYENIRTLIRVWFEGVPSDEKTDYITDFLFSSGSWGSADSHLTSGAVRDQHGKRGDARWKYLAKLAFPRADSIKDKYTILQKAPWMLPLVWIYRPFYKLFSARERATLGTYKKNLQLLTPETVNSRQEALRYVGLDYHF